MPLLRFPGASCPPDALTGDRVLDSYLVELDSRLLGSAKVRLLSLAEIKDHLQERTAAVQAKASTPVDAATVAVNEMGPAKSHADTQRAALTRRFLTIALQAGTAFFVIDMLFEWLRVGAVHSVWSLSIQGLFAGLLLGWWFTFVRPPRLLPSASVEDEFSVGYSSKMRVASYAVACVFVATFVIGLGAALGIEAVNPFGWNQTMGIVFALLSAFTLRNIRMGIRTYRVDREGFSIEGVGSTERIPWSAIKSLRPLGEIKPWIPKWNHWSKVVALDYAKPDGHTGRINIFPDTANADRFISLVREKLEGRRSPDQDNG